MDRTELVWIGTAGGVLGAGISYAYTFGGIEGLGVLISVLLMFVVSTAILIMLGNGLGLLRDQPRSAGPRAKQGLVLFALALTVGLAIPIFRQAASERRGDRP